MRLFSIVMIFFLFWFLSLFAVLPFSANPPEEVGATAAPGHAESAPHVFRPWPIILRTTIVSAILFAIFYGCYREGWLDIRLQAGTTLESGQIK
jgi:predicted secreted protein